MLSPFLFYCALPGHTCMRCTRQEPRKAGWLARASWLAAVCCALSALLFVPSILRMCVCVFSVFSFVFSCIFFVFSLNLVSFFCAYNTTVINLNKKEVSSSAKKKRKKDRKRGRRNDCRLYGFGREKKSWAVARINISTTITVLSIAFFKTQ